MQESYTDTQNFQFIPPFNDSKQFELFTEDLFNEIHKTTDFQRRSRYGQEQDYHDVFCNRLGILIECKLKDIYLNKKEDIRIELIKELNEYAQALYSNRKQNKVKKFYLLSTFPDDGEIQNEATRLSSREMTVSFWGWKKILDELGNCPKTYQKYKPQLDDTIRDFIERKQLSSVPNSLRDNSKTPFDLLKEFQETFYPLLALKPNTLQRLFPFDNTDEYIYHNRFFLDVKNTKVKLFLQDIKLRRERLIYSKNKKISHKQLEGILDLCAGNLYYYIAGKEENKSHKLPIIFETNCKCQRCNFNNLDFKQLLTQFKKTNSDLSLGYDRDKLKNAFVNFKVGNFRECYLQLKFLLKTSANNHSVLKFIVHYNLQNLYYQIDADYFGKDKQKILKEIEQYIDTHKLISNCDLKEKKEQLEWINEDAFVKGNAIIADEAIAKINASIERQYNAQGAVDELLDILSNSHAVIQTNFLLYDIYGIYETYIEKSVDALVGAAAVQKSYFKNEKIRGFPISQFHFNDFLLDLMIFHCGTDRLKQIFNKYKIKELYSQQNTVLKKLENILQTYPYAKKIFKKRSKNRNYFFENRLERTIANLFLVVSKLKFTSVDFKDIPDLLCDFIRKENEIAWSALDTIRYLIFHDKDETHFSVNSLEKLLNLSYTKAYGKHGLLQTFAEAIEYYYPSYTLKSGKLCNLIIKNYTKDKFRDLISLWRISNTRTKNKISSFFIELFSKDFDDVVYFYVAINKIIDYKLFFNEYIKKLKPYFIHWTFERVGNNFKPFFVTPNWFISFVYRLEIDTTLPGIQELAQSKEYFNWLLNLSTFDYSKFQLEWIGVYDHPSYFKKLKTITKLKDKIEELLKTNYDSYLSDLYYKKFFSSEPLLTDEFNN